MLSMSNVSPSGPPMAASPLTVAVLEIDEYASGLGWDQPARLFALVDTAKLRVQEPGLAAQLGLDSPDSTTAALTPIEQEELPPERRWTSSSPRSPGPTRSPAAP